MNAGAEAGRRVMLGMGSRAMAALIENALKPKGYQIAVPEDGDEMLLRISEYRPDLVMLQDQFHTKDGFKLFHSIRKMNGFQELPVVMVAGEDLGERCSEAGIRYLIRIPFEAEQLSLLVETIFAHGRSILLVDDSRVIHKDLGDVLSSAGYHVLHGYDGEEGVRMVRQFRPDLVITDIEMPKMTGYQLCQKIKTETTLEFMPVIICSSLSGGIDVEKGFEAGANDYLTKPLDKAELLDLVRRYFESMKLRGRERILVVDDADLIRGMVRIGLAQQGFTVDIARDGREGYEKCLSFKPDVLVTDFNMPGMDGLELAARLKEKEETKAISVVMMTARDSKAELSRATRAGLAGFITKPFQVDKLLVIVERLLAERRLQREKEAMKHYLSEAALKQAEEVAAQKSSPMALRADEKKLTILFSDICGFTPTCERLKPREVVDLLNDYFDLLTKILREHDAIVDKFIGDAIMAVFEESSEASGALRAVRSGFTMQAALQDFNKGRATPFNMRVGINTGVVIQGDIGSRFLRRDFTVIGDNVNLAQRLESAAPHGGVLISQATLDEVRSEVEVDEVPPLTLKGKSEKVQAYVVRSVK
ncbi:MAG: response regulator [Nitrospirae bacterium]|nr:response regulator [Nitrospirota bacterium]